MDTHAPTRDEALARRKEYNTNPALIHRASGSMWDRLPLEIKEEFLEKKRKASARALAFRAKLKTPRRNTALAGLIASALIGCIMAELEDVYH